MAGLGLLAKPTRLAIVLWLLVFFIDADTLIGGVVVAWPLAARAQQPERMRRIGVLSGLAENDPEGRARIAAFRDGLQRLGWNAVAVTRANSAGIVGDGGTW